MRLTAKLMNDPLHTLLNRGLPPDATIRPRVAWPLWFTPFLVIGQLLTPHPVWVTLMATLAGLYLLGYFWVRGLARGLSLTRTRRSTLLIAGDTLEEEFILQNRTHLPVFWAECADASDLPAYDPSRVVAVASVGIYTWRASVRCRRRGVYRLGPGRVISDDPFGLFRLRLDFPETQRALIYPRVLQLPDIALPRGQTSGAARRRRPQGDVAPAACVREYRPGDARRDIHWRSTAHRNRLMARMRELEPSGDVWIALDLNRAAHSGAGAASTLEYAITLAASLTAELVTSSERRAVGLLATTGTESGAQEVIWLPPRPGRAQLWRVLAALAPVEPGDTPLAELLFRSRDALGHRRTLIAITADLDPVSDSGRRSWPAELVRLQAAGIASSALLVTSVPPGDDENTAVDLGVDARVDGLRSLLVGLNIPAQSLSVGLKLPPALTYRRTRTVIRSTPTGGAIRYEVEEEVG
jgi:uncharacterized protein (DUF58 family)